MVGRAIVNAPFYWKDTDSILYKKENTGSCLLVVYTIAFLDINQPTFFSYIIPFVVLIQTLMINSYFLILLVLSIFSICFVYSFLSPHVRSTF